MTTWTIDYTYDCWKCPDRHAASYSVDAPNAEIADLKWRGDMLGDFHGAHDYNLLVIDVRKETK